MGTKRSDEEEKEIEAEAEDEEKTKRNEKSEHGSDSKLVRLHLRSLKSNNGSISSSRLNQVHVLCTCTQQFSVARLSTRHPRPRDNNINLKKKKLVFVVLNLSSPDMFRHFQHVKMPLRKWVKMGYGN